MGLVSVVYLQQVGYSNGSFVASEIVPVTSNGETERIFNGRPDWVYEEEVIGDSKMFYWSPNGKYRM